MWLCVPPLCYHLLACVGVCILYTTKYKPGKTRIANIVNIYLEIYYRDVQGRCLYTICLTR